MRTIAVIQARMESTRLPGKVLEPIAGQPLLAWTIAAVHAVVGVDGLVLATTVRSADDRLAELAMDFGLRVHRGSAHDVLRRVRDAIAPFEPDLVLRQTGDNPFPDPDVMASQVRRLVDGGLDYVGIAGLPLGIGAEVVTAAALGAADREATNPADREHVLPFIYARPERFAIGALDEPPPWRHRRYTVDTAADLAFARALAQRLPSTGGPARLADLEAIVSASPELAELNRTVEQRRPDEAEPVAGSGHEET